MIRFRWPDEPIPDLTHKPCVHVTVTQVRDQVALHRALARAGYVPERGRIQANDDYEIFEYVHPDGERGG